jgi:hypothetical protein
MTLFTGLAIRLNNLDGKGVFGNKMVIGWGHNVMSIVDERNCHRIVVHKEKIIFPN